jgi:ribonuclease T1
MTIVADYFSVFDAKYLASLFCAVSLLLAPWASDARDKPRIGAEVVALADLPSQAHDTLALIRKGGPFPYKRDGVVFNNFERRLPVRERGYYREYTVPTPGIRDRGARRIVAGRDGEFYYTGDHYRTFRRIRE